MGRNFARRPCFKSDRTLFRAFLIQIGIWHFLSTTYKAGFKATFKATLITLVVFRAIFKAISDQTFFNSNRNLVFLSTTFKARFKLRLLTFKATLITLVMFRAIFRAVFKRQVIKHYLEHFSTQTGNCYFLSTFKARFKPLFSHV